MEGVSPTRMDLLDIRKRMKLANKGHKLLSEKRDALVVQFFEMLEKRKKLRSETESSFTHAYGSLVESEMVLGENKVREIAMGMTALDDIPMGTLSIMGVPVPQLKLEAVQRGSLGYSLIDTSSKLDETVEAFRYTMEIALQLAEIEGGIEMLAGEIEKTKRRVNALEHIFIPKLVNTEKFIEMQLEEREREDFFRRKKIKARMRAKSS